MNIQSKTCYDKVNELAPIMLAWAGEGMATADTLFECPRSRREDILEAAAACFVEEGFHGASMARIAKRADVSPGHIYHYFESKDELIHEIIRSEEARHLSFFDDLADLDAPELRAFLIGRVKEGVTKTTRLFHSVLTLETLAEASRNPDVSAIVHRYDTQIHRRFSALLRDTLGLKDADHRVEVLRTLFSGLAIRTVRNPKLDATALTPQIVRAVAAILTPDPEQNAESHIGQSES